MGVMQWVMLSYYNTFLYSTIVRVKAIICENSFLSYFNLQITIVYTYGACCGILIHVYLVERLNQAN
jgi:hypothetical protein